MGYDRTVFALGFAARWLEAARWRDCIGRTVATSLQVSASFYPLLGAALATPPFLVWLLRRHGWRRIAPAQLAFVVSGVGLAVYLVLVPYLHAPTESGVLHRP